MKNIKHSEPYESDFGYMKLTASMNMFANDEADIILNLDLDCLIANHEIKIETIYDYFNQKDLYDIYRNGVETADKYRVQNYLNNYIQPLIDKL